MFILSDGDFFDDDGSRGIINGINNNCQDDTGLSRKFLFKFNLITITFYYLIFISCYFCFELMRRYSNKCGWSGQRYFERRKITNNNVLFSWSFYGYHRR